jgi:hypothetical protein
MKKLLVLSIASALLACVAACRMTEPSTSPAAPGAREMPQPATLAVSAKEPPALSARVDAILHPVAPVGGPGLAPETVAAQREAAKSILHPVLPTPKNAADAETMARALAGIQPVPPSR